MAVEETLLEAIDHALTMLGTKVRQTIYDHIEKTRGLNRTDVPDHIKVFHEALAALFGEGTQSIERVIAGRVYQRLGRTFTPNDGWTLASDPIICQPDCHSGTEQHRSLETQT